VVAGRGTPESSGLRFGGAARPASFPRLGVTLPQFTAEPEVLIGAARRAEGLGLDSVWVFDHLWPLSGGKERPVLECWTALAWLASATTSVQIGTLVTRSSLRHAALLAKMAATVAAIAPGRVVVTIGSGDELSRPENEAFGLPYYAGEDRARQLEGAAEVLLRYWTEERVTYRDRFNAIDSLPSSPRPDPRPRLWIGGRSEALRAFAARRADGWNGWGGSPTGYAIEAARVRELAGARVPEITWGGLALLAASDEQARAKIGKRDPSAYIVGGPLVLADRLIAMHRGGAEHLVLTFPDAADPAVYEILAEQVRPRLNVE
jgi:alkanesulfonate monooxygenase SsuD/methylene tetrahydromethanopterin reductase-like flavin-dependent oxidoreductase (luciferase family)